MIIRKEIPADIPAIHELLYTAFKGHPHHEPGAEPTEHKIVDQLRDKGELTLSLVAGQDNKIVGHIAFSPVMINGEDLNWLGLAPVAVAPEYQGQGIGAALINESLNQLQKQGVKGFVLLGSPGYYQRFGFTRHPELTYPGPPPEYFLALPCNNEVPAGKILLFFCLQLIPDPPAKDELCNRRDKSKLHCHLTCSFYFTVLR